jgi:hypothetical protein
MPLLAEPIGDDGQGSVFVPFVFFFVIKKYFYFMNQFLKLFLTPFDK